MRKNRRAPTDTLASSRYPPDAEADAIKRVLDQMEAFADDWFPEA